MDISIIVVTYNQESTIRQTLESILSQEFTGTFEILIGDDNSTDGTGEVCEEFATAYPDKIRYIRRARNIGVVRNYFDCIERARGRYLADCAGDDYWVDTSKLQREYDYMEKHPDVAMVTTDWLCLDWDKTQTEGRLELYRSALRDEVKEPEVRERESLFVPVLEGKDIQHLCTSLYRRQPIVEKMTRYPEIMKDSRFVTEDTQIVLTSNEAGKIVVLPGVTLHYRVGHDSISNRKSIDQRLEYSLRAMRQQILLARHFGVERELNAAYMRGKTDYLHALAFHSGDCGLRDSMYKIVKEFCLKGGLKTGLYRISMKSNLLWRLLRHIHRG